MTKKETKKILHLTLKKEWFDLIAKKEKTVENREIKPYWSKRLEGKTFNEIHFKNGYAKNAPFMIVKWKGMKKDKQANKYRIQLGKILKIENY